jgi:hypothetical protein
MWMEHLGHRHCRESTERKCIVLWFLGFRMCGNGISVYILNLAMADSLILCFYLYESLYKFRVFSCVINFHLLKFLITVRICVYIAGLSMLSVISLECCLSVLCSIWYLCCHPDTCQPTYVLSSGPCPHCWVFWTGIITVISSLTWMNLSLVSHLSIQWLHTLFFCL